MAEFKMACHPAGDRRRLAVRDRGVGRRDCRSAGAARRGVLGGHAVAAACVDRDPSNFSALAGQLRRHAREAGDVAERDSSRWRRRCARPSGAPLGDLFSFMSGLYFRGKLTYARRFARPPEPDNPIVGSGIHVITPNAGLRSPGHAGDRATPCARSRSGDIDADNAKLPPSARGRARARCSRRSAPSATSCCSAASRRRSTSTS